MEQLDLFGFPVEMPKQTKKKEPVSKAPAVVEEKAPPVVEAPVAEIQLAVAVVEEIVPAPESIESFVEEAPFIIEDQPELLTIQTIAPVAVEEETIIAPPKIIKEKKLLKPASKRGRKSFREMDSEVDLVDIPEEAVLQQKLYYSISEVAGWFKVNTSLLRFWENEFDILQPRKTRKGDRLFRVEDIKNLQLIYFLLRQRKFSIDGAKKYLKNHKREADTQAQLVQSLNKFRSFLLELKTNMAS